MGIIKDWLRYKRDAKRRKTLLENLSERPRITDQNRIKVNLDNEISEVAVLLVVGVILALALAGLTVWQEKKTRIDYEKVYHFDPSESVGQF